MFGKLKDKLKGIQQSLGSAIDKKAVVIEETIEKPVEKSALEPEIIASEPEQVDIGDAGQVTESVGTVEVSEVSEVSEISDETVSGKLVSDDAEAIEDVPYTTAELKSNIKKPSIFKKVKTLVLEREVYLDESDISD